MRVVAGLALATTVGSCAAGEPPPRPADLALERERAFLLPPQSGFGLALDPTTAQALQRGHQALMSSQPEAAMAEAAGLLGRDEDLAPAHVLAAQVELVERAFGDAARRLKPVVERYPEFLAARLVQARALEALDEIPEAFAAYRAVARESSVASDRASALRPRALEILARRAGEELRRGRPEAAREVLARMEEWAPEDLPTLQTAFAVYQATGEQERQLAAVRDLLAHDPADPVLRERRGDLELAIGDPNAALEIFERLLASEPGSLRLAEKLARAKFRWRLRNLPQEVQLLVDEPVLDRAGFAVLLYWLVPEVRAGVGAAPRIATDILDHPQRQQIARVVNLGLMRVDDNLRRFRPDDSLRRIDALRALLRVLERSRPPAACVEPLAGNPSPSAELLCATASRCGLLPEVGDCLPETGVSGAEALEWIRLAGTY